MSLNPETITQIQTMLQADPALLAQLKVQTELAGAAAMIAKAAATQGVDVSESDVMRHLAAGQSQAAAMSDAELEQVAGGALGGATVVSVISLGVGCAGLSFFADGMRNESMEKPETCGKAWRSFFNF